MSKRFKIEQEPFLKGQQIFCKNSVTINEGITVLVGCNGCGKTTMLKQIRDQLKAEDAKFVYYDYVKVRENKSGLMQTTDVPVAQFASWVSNSEGEQIVVAMNLLARKIGEFVRQNTGADVFVLLDAVDSGLSIDNVVELKSFFGLIAQDVAQHGGHAYVIVTANSYEMAAGVSSIDVHTCENVVFTTYSEYKKFVLKSAKEKEHRE